MDYLGGYNDYEDRCRNDNYKHRDEIRDSLYKTQADADDCAKAHDEANKKLDMVNLANDLLKNIGEVQK